MAEIEGLVRALREGDDAAKTEAARALGGLAGANRDNRVRIAEAGSIAPLVQLLRDGDAAAKARAAWTLSRLAYYHETADIKVLVAEAGGVPLLVELLRDGSADAKEAAAWALYNLARDNASNTVAIAAAVGLETLVQLARRGRLTVDKRNLVHNAALPAKRKAALVVAALLRDCVPVSVPREIKAVIGPYL